MESFEVFVWPAGAAGVAEAYEREALKYSYGLPERLVEQRRMNGKL